MWAVGSTSSYISSNLALRRGRGALHLRAPEDVHHLLGGVGAGGVPLPAEDLALGGEAQLGGQVVLGLGRRGVHLVLLGLAVAENGDRQIKYRQCWNGWGPIQ